jgi:hypothetical protein
MRKKLVSVLSVLSLGVSLACGRGPGLNQAENSRVMSKCGSQPDCAVLLYFLPARTEVTALPLVFAVSPTANSKTTIPTLRRARLVFISADEMRGVVEALSAKHLSWEEMSQPAQLEPAPETMPTSPGMKITVTCHLGNSKTHIIPTRICDEVGAAVGPLRGKRGRWELENYLTTAGCSFPGFDPREFEPK